LFFYLPPFPRRHLPFLSLLVSCCFRPIQFFPFPSNLFPVKFSFPLWWFDRVHTPGRLGCHFLSSFPLVCFRSFRPFVFFSSIPFSGGRLVVLANSPTPPLSCPHPPPLVVVNSASSARNAECFWSGLIISEPHRLHCPLRLGRFDNGF